MHMLESSEDATQSLSAPLQSVSAQPPQNGSRPQRRLITARSICVMEAGIGSVFLGLWVFLFAAGDIIGTQPYRDQLSHPGSVAAAIQLWIVVLSCYTVTNVAILCCLTSYLGTLGRRCRIGGQERELQDDALKQYTAAVMRGFFVYIGIVSGTVALTGPAAFTNTSPETYLRLAATASLVSFLAGYKPQLFGQLQRRLDTWVTDLPDGAHVPNGTALPRDLDGENPTARDIRSAGTAAVVGKRTD